jgi:hypothetical protein
VQEKTLPSSFFTRVKPVQVKAIYENGRLEFTRPIQLKRDRLTLLVEVPDEDIVTDTAETLPTYDLNAFPEEIRREVARMQAINEMASKMPLPACVNEKDSGEQEQRTRAFELRNALRREQGRPA